jgi:hypothetical protein
MSRRFVWECGWYMVKSEAYALKSAYRFDLRNITCDFSKNDMKVNTRNTIFFSICLEQYYVTVGTIMNMNV